MRKLLLFILFAIFTTVSYSQHIPLLKAGLPKHVKANSKFNMRQVTDTQSQFADSALTIYFDRATNWEDILGSPFGYVFGTSYYYDGLNYHPAQDATGCHFDGIGSGTIIEVQVWAGEKIIAGNSDSISVNVYDIGADTIPTTLLGTSKISTADLDTTGDYGFRTIVLMNATINSSFLVTVEYPNIDDTISFFSSDTSTAATFQHPAGVGDGLGQKRTRQRLLVDFGTGTGWRPISDLYQGGMDADVIFVPVVDIQNGMTEFKNELFTLKPVNPVPSTGLVNLEYMLADQTNVSYRVMDAHGRVLIKSDSQLKQPSRYKEIIDMKAYKAGNYYITFNAGSKTLTQKMILVK